MSAEKNRKGYMLDDKYRQGADVGEGEKVTKLLNSEERGGSIGKVVTC
jgi:hypothetical protein